MNEIITQDKEAMIFLNNLGSTPFDQFWILLSEKTFWIPLYVIFLFLLYKNFSLKNFLYILLFIAIGVTVSDQLANIFKDGIARLRPCHEPSLDHLIREVKCGGQFGFYSGHSSNVFFIANFLTILLYKKYRFLPIFLFVWAGFVAYSRIYLGVHYPMDVVFGSLMGFFLGGFFASLAWKVISKNSI